MTAAPPRWTAQAGLLDADRSALAIVERLLDCAAAARRSAEAWRFLGFAAVNLDELLTTHGPNEDVDKTCLLDAVRPPTYRRAIAALLRRVDQLQGQWLKAEGVGPVALQALTPRQRTSAVSMLGALWPDLPAAPAVAPSLPSRRLALLLRPTARGNSDRVWCVPVPDAVPRFLPAGPRGRLLCVSEVAAAWLQAEGIPLAVVPFRPLRRERTFAWHDLAADPAEGVQALVRVRESGPLFAVAHGLRLQADERAALAAQLTGHPGLIEPRMRWLSTGPLLDLAPLASLPAPAIVKRGVARRTPPPAAARTFAEQLRQGDVLIGFPGHAFGETVVRFVAEAAVDPAVTQLDLTVYRVDAHSALLHHCIAAAARGVRVRVTTELQARGDELRNLAWRERLLAAGVQVDTGPLSLKVHAKLVLVRRGADGTAQAFIGTGNLHAGTARAYNDYGLLTAAAALTADVAAVFAAIRGEGVPELHELAAAPWSLRTRMAALVDEAVRAARAGHRVRLYVKLNGLTDPTLIEELQLAAARGVHVALSVRGLCLARPRSDDRLRVIAPAGHLLHHARGLALRVDDAVTAAWIGSADWRERNLDRRVEVWTPLHDPAHRTFLANVLAGDCHRAAGWELLPDGRYRPPARLWQHRRLG